MQISSARDISYVSRYNHRKPAPAGKNTKKSGKNPAPSTGGNIEQELTPENKKKVEKLEKRDREVRAHEQAHRGAAGPYARGGGYTYQSGPDGKRYAVGGHVDIDASPVPNNPEATLRKEQRVRRAALAPADPSAQDRRVAARAAKAEQNARKQIREEKSNKPGDKKTIGTGRPSGTISPQTITVDSFDKPQSTPLTGPETQNSVTLDIIA